MDACTRRLRDTGLDWNAMNAARAESDPGQEKRQVAFVCMQNRGRMHGSQSRHGGRDECMSAFAPPSIKAIAPRIETRMKEEAQRKSRGPWDERIDDFGP